MFRVLIIILLFPATVSAQMEITWGIPEKSEKTSALNGVVGYTPEHIYCSRRDNSISKNNGTIVLEKIERDSLKLIGSYRINFDLLEDVNYSTIGVFIIKQQLYIMGSAYQKSTQKMLFVGQILNPDFSVSQKWKVIDAAEIAPLQEPGKWYCNLTSDSSGLLVYSNKAYYEKLDDYFELFFLDLGLNRVWSNKIYVAKDGYYSELFNFKVGPGGIVYFLAIQSMSLEAINRETRRHANGYSYTLCRYDPISKNLIQRDITIPKGRAINIAMKLDNRGEVLCAGLFSGDTTLDVQGTFFQLFDKTSCELILKNEVLFPADSLDQKCEVSGTTWAYPYFSYNIKSLIQNNDGSVVLIFDQIYKLLSTEHYLNNVMVVCVDGNFNGAWFRSQHLGQKYALKDYPYISCAVVHSTNGVHLIYNTGKTNPHKGAVVMASIASSGKVSVSNLFPGEYESNHLQPRGVFQIKPNEAILVTTKDKYTQYGLLNLTN